MSAPNPKHGYIEKLEGRLNAYPIVYVAEQLDERVARKFRRDIVKRDRKTKKRQFKNLRWALGGAYHGKSR
jgi:uridine kinase